MRYSNCRNAQVFTYFLGNSLYVPLTSRCNSVTLPASRGPNFLVPPSVVAAICRVRDAEDSSTLWSPWIAYLDQQDGLQRMPNPIERVSGIPDEVDTKQRPSVEELLQEIQPILEDSGSSEDEIASVVFAGEGEPTLRLTSLIAVATGIRQLHPTIPVRLATNGLTPAAMTTNVPEKLFQSGISHVSVALMTHDADLYESLMMPELVEEETGNNDVTTLCAHERMCDFIRQAVKCGLQVEATAVERDGVDRTKTEALATALGAQKFRWRTHFS